MTWSTDKIIALGLLAAFFASVVLGGDKDLQSLLAGGLLGFLSRNSTEVKKNVEAVDEAKDAAKK
jgi:hypothetical protein